MADSAKAREDKGLAVTAVILILGGLLLLVVAMLSKHWLEIPSDYRHDPVIAAGLFGEEASSSARMLGIVLMVLSGVLALVGLVMRQLLAAALVLAVGAAAALSWWIFDQREWFAGRAYTLAMFALVMMIVGLAQAAASARNSEQSTGTYVDGKKHGRWYVYDGAGKCITMEEWDHGTLVSSKPQQT